MLQRVLCPVLVGRDEELSALEDALLAANRGESRFLLLAGEAGMGKTRLAAELARRARKLGCEVLWGSCSEAELSLPYLPFVEAVGNYLAAHDPAELAARLGPPARELSQLFPQLADGGPPVATGDLGQAKLRLFESMVALLALPARERGLLLVVEDVHWADSSTRELLDHLARRLVGARALVVCTYRSDELERRHALVPALQAWRRSGLAETVELAALHPRRVAEMISAILDTNEVGGEFGELMHDRSEGNPFVLEEMLKEAIDRGDVFRTDVGWERRSLEELRVPETVRDAILLRLTRLDETHVEVLRAAAVLGRSFDYDTLAAVAEAEDAAVQGALTSAVAQQLVVEDVAGRYRWRHALTQEAIATDIVLPRRQRIHSRAADALAAPGGGAVESARHLLAAGRFEEAVPACMRGADEAERAVAFGEAIELIEHALPHVHDGAERARLLCRMGWLRWLNGESAAAQQLLGEGVPSLEEARGPLEVAHYRLALGRCHWELHRPDLALQEFERARETLEPEGPSGDLASAYTRLAGLRLFELDGEGCVEFSRRAVETAEAAGADFDRIWALSFVASGLCESGRLDEGLATFAECSRAALAKGYAIIAWNLVHNELWIRLHGLIGGFEAVFDRFERIPAHPWVAGSIQMVRSWGALAAGEPRAALEGAEQSRAASERLGHAKVVWRASVAAAEALLELGRPEDAVRVLPASSTRTELQDFVYDATARVRTLLALGQVDEAVAEGRAIASEPRLALFGETLAVAAEAFVAAGLLEEARTIVAAGRARPALVADVALDEADGRILLAAGDAGAALEPLGAAACTLAERGLRLGAWRVRILLVEALARTGETERAAELLDEIVAETHRAGARRLRDLAVAAATEHGLPVPELLDEPEAEPLEPEVAAGERLVTSLFADVRGYTKIAQESAPEQLADRMAALHRWAAAEVGRRHGIVDKFAGDAVMATFNAVGARVDHATLALEAALALRDKAALADLPVGVGIASGAAVVGRSVSGANVSVLGSATNLAARLQTAAAGGEILLSDEAYRRVEAWLSERGLDARREELELKGFDGKQVAYRLGLSA